MSIFDYDSIYKNFGFSFKYTNGYLSRSKPIDPNKLDSSKSNSDNLFVFCGSCKEWMEFQSGEGIMNGYWKCPCCGKRVREMTVYKKLDQENDHNPYNEFYS